MIGVRVVEDMHEYNAHLLEIVAIPLRQVRSQQAQRSLIQAGLPPNPT